MSAVNAQPEPHAPPPVMPDQTRDLVGVAMALTQVQLTIRKMLVRADADAARKLLEVRS
jgi:hypothetical protein